MKSFAARTTLRLAVLVTSTTALVLMLGGWLLTRLAVNGLDLLNRAEYIEIRDRIGPNPGALTAAELDRLVRPHTEVDAALYYFQIHNAAKAILFRSVNLGPAELPDLSGGELRASVAVPGLGEVRLCEFYDGPLHVQIASSLDPARRLLRDYVRVSLLLLGVVAAASIGLGWGFARVTLRPVRAIYDTAARIRGDNLSERIPLPAGRDELVSLTQLLNRMFDGLEAAFVQMTRFTADASHEFKTPLALIRLNAERIRPRLASDPEASAALADILEETDRLRRITEGLLFLARADSGTFVPVTSGIAIEKLVESFGEDAAALAEDRDVHFAVARSDRGIVRCEPTLIRQLLLNLATNAIRASRAGGRVQLESVLAGGAWRLTICDEGPGLARDQLERAFEPFVRYASTAAPDQNSGHGLGLAICRSIATLHGGRIRAENRAAGSGLCITVEMPWLT